MEDKDPFLTAQRKQTDTKKAKTIGGSSIAPKTAHLLSKYLLALYLHHHLGN